MNKVEEIFKAWNIAFNPNSEQAELASKRIEICNSCEHKVTNLGINRCSVCGCALKGKVFSPVKGACPKGKWDEVDEVMVKGIEITSEDTIFIQIASYRDPELIPTIKDCISKAKYPERLSFGICWQHSEEDVWDNLDEFKENPAFTIMDVPWYESKGLCWARHHIQKMWKGEKYTLQIDSHHRFLQDWDVELIKMMYLTESPKPILTSYAGMYRPETNELLNKDPYKMVGKKFTLGGTILFYPETIQGWETLIKPVPARFVSGHFFFTYGIHCEEYKYDPNLYFAGDEISLSIRSFTLGYDLFHPHKLVIWHEYTREGRVKHWDDFQSKNADKIEKTFGELDDVSKKRLRQMLQEENNGSDITGYGLGTARSHKEYEIYAGIDFANRILHPDLIAGIDPPTTVEQDSDWRTLQLTVFNKEVTWSQYINHFKKEISNLDDIQFIYVGIEDTSGKLLFRKDITDPSYLSFENTSLVVNLGTYQVPHILIVWPYLKNEGWKSRIDILL